MKITFDERTFRIIFYTCYLAIALSIACAILSASTVGPGEGYFYVKESVISEGTGSGESFHELGKLGEETGYHTGADGATNYNYEGKLDKDGTTTQTSEFSGEGFDGSNWNRHIIWATDVAGSHDQTIRVGKINDSYYGKSGMKITYAEGDGTEEFESNIKIDTLDGNATIAMSVIRWEGAGEMQPEYNESTGEFVGYIGGETVGKPATLDQIKRVGQVVIDQFVQIKEDKKTPGDWLGFCASLDDKLPDGFIVRPSTLDYDQGSGTHWNTTNATVYQVDI